MVPDSDDSTEEDEDYQSYIHEQQEQHLRKQAENNNGARNLRHMLHEDDDTHMGSQQDHDMDLDANTNNQLLQARQNEILDDEEFDDDEEMEEEDDDDERSETVSLTEEDIDFNLVYAFHTFVATQEGQASVVRNDALMLLEDTNVYWWLVRVLKTGVIGYIPAENIEVRRRKRRRKKWLLNTL